MMDFRYREVQIIETNDLTDKLEFIAVGMMIVTCLLSPAAGKILSIILTRGNL